MSIVTTTVPLWEDQQRWSLSPEPEVRIGVVEGEAPYLFRNIRSVLRLDNGVLVVADDQSRELRFFDSDGIFVRAVGGPGQGPGEFESLSWVARCDGGLFVYDRRQRRISVWSEDGEFSESFPLVEPSSGSVPYRARCGPDGSFILAGWGQRPRMPRRDAFMFYQQPASVWLVDAQLEPVAELGEYVSSERVRTSRGGSGPHPFGREVVFAQDEEHLYIGSSERLEVEVRNRTGEVIRVMRGPDADLVVDDNYVVGYRSAEMSRPDSLIRDRLAAAEMPMPPRLPAYTEILSDGLGNVWVERFRVPWAGSNRWGVFSPDGEFYGHVEMPDGFQLMSVTPDYVLGVSRDEFEVERADVYRLNRTPSE